MPPVLANNVDILELWQDISTQWRGTGMGIIGLDYKEVRIRADELDIKLNECAWRKIRILERIELKKQGKKQDV